MHVIIRNYSLCVFIYILCAHSIYIIITTLLFHMIKAHNTFITNFILQLITSLKEINDIL